MKRATASAAAIAVVSRSGTGACTNHLAVVSDAGTAIYLTGDSWSAAGMTYRLYGVQACLRGTSFTNAHGLKRDCGEASLAMLAALDPGSPPAML